MNESREEGGADVLIHMSFALRAYKYTWERARGLR